MDVITHPYLLLGPPYGVRADLEQPRQLSNATAFLIPHTGHLGSMLRR